MQMIGFYLVRGHDIDKLVNLSVIEKIAYRAFMEQHYEEENERMNAMFGGGSK